ncbi:RlmE family RNA methyltransferase [Desulfonema ishimotonii]|uniref:Ribosomal RNA large subunit methyltransferase E n=1 Tax=Desulfonema ishimotonii TaxID=45657 RepID=A0A401FV99_9BACT|nr:RlmE family RNA methyltransferase [Desulfonema ishimotonii]GBC60878.1 RlmE family RNA methyltransferase [Desulfonema ishimotonii]
MKRAVSKRNKNKWADHYTQKAQKEKYPARSVYKLIEIQNKTRVIKKGDRVLDLGCAPGSWLMYAAEITGSGGRVVGIDLKPVNVSLPPHATAYAGDIFDMSDEIRDAVGSGYNAVISDMAPSTTGNSSVDAARSFNLCEAALAVAHEVLLPGGIFVCKIFQGPDFEMFLNRIKTEFDKHKIFKPQSSRKASREIFIIGLGKK